MKHEIKEDEKVCIRAPALQQGLTYKHSLMWDLGKTKPSFHFPFLGTPHAPGIDPSPPTKEKY